MMAAVARTGTDTMLRGGIEPLLFPRSVAVIGASPTNAEAIANVLRGGVPAFGIHPTRIEASGLRCLPSVAELDEPSETALLLVGHTRVEDAFADCAAAGIRAFVLPGLGAEAGADGPAIAERIALRAAEIGASILGPNCMGAAAPERSSPWIGTVPDTFVEGRVSVVSQSGSIAEALLACGPRVGFRTVVSCGGEMARDAADFLGFFAGDAGTRAIGVFLETVRRPDALAEALARCAEAGKPVVCLKVGRSQAAARAALAHTGALVGSDRAFSALLHHHGAIRVDDFHDLLETLEVLGRGRRPRGVRVAAVSESGGECALLADHAEAAGIPFEPLPDGVAQQLSAEFPNFVSPGNPLDCWAIADERIVYPRSLELMASSGAYDILLAQIDLSQFRGRGETEWCELIVRSLGEVTASTGLFPAVTSVHASDPPTRIAALARAHDIALLRGPGHAMRALAAAARWRPVARAAEGGEPLDLSDLLGGADGPLPELESSLVLERYGVEVTPRRRAASAAEAAAAADELGFPVVVKRDGPAHKAAEGGVVLGLESSEAVAVAAERLGGKVLVARQVVPGPEVFCGMTRDPDYGPVLAAGLGGLAVEELGHAAVTLAPVAWPDALRLLRESPGLARLPDQALETLARALAALSRFALEHPEVVEVDVNPLIVGPAGAVAVDALVVVDRAGVQ
jgi:acetyltransferase